MELLKLSDQALINELHRRVKCEQIKDSQRIVLIGPPGRRMIYNYILIIGSGKATHSYKLMQRFCLCHISTGDLLKKEVRRESLLGNKMKQYLMQGELVPDNIIHEMVEYYMNRPECKHGAILDGFPRTIEQAQDFDKYLNNKNQSIWKAIYFKIPDNVIKDRIKGRLVHLSSGRTYNLQYYPPVKEGLDDITNEPLSKRFDDKDDIIEKRISNFHRKTEPMLEYYQKKGILQIIDANQSVTKVWRQIRDVFTNEIDKYKNIQDNQKIVQDNNIKK